MSWYISITINEVSREEAIRELEKTVKTIKAGKTMFNDPVEQDPKGIPYTAYDSYEGL